MEIENENLTKQYHLVWVPQKKWVMSDKNTLNQTPPKPFNS